MTRPLRLLFLYDRIYPEDLGGVEHRNLELGLALARRGHRVTLAGWAEQSGARGPGVEVLSLGRPRAFYSRSGKRKTGLALRLAAQAWALDLDPYDALETANIPYAHLPALALRARRAGKPLLVTWYEYWGRYWRDYLGPVRGPLYAAVERLVAPLGSRAVASSELTRERLSRRRQDQVGLLPCGVHSQRVRAAAREGRPGPPLLYAGRLLKEKRVELLLQAVALLASGAVGGTTSGALLAVIGDGPERARLEALARTLGIGERVEFRGQVGSSEEVWRAMGGARVAVQPSSREGFGMFPLEALTAGLPVVYCESTESAVAEVVRHEREGLRLDASPAALHAALASLLGEESQWQRLHEGALARGTSYDWDRLAERAEEIFLELLEVSRAPSVAGSKHL